MKISISFSPQTIKVKPPEAKEDSLRTHVTEDVIFFSKNLEAAYVGEFCTQDTFRVKIFIDLRISRQNNLDFKTVIHWRDVQIHSTQNNINVKNVYN